MENKLTHTDENGQAKMVQVTDKAITRRCAGAEGYILITEDIAHAIRENTLKKGDVFSVARIAGIMAVKKGLAYLQFILAPNSPLIVPDRQMEDFIRFYESGAYQEPEFLDARQMSELRSNAKVVIGDGPFEGL